MKFTYFQLLQKFKYEGLFNELNGILKMII